MEEELATEEIRDKLYIIKFNDNNMKRGYIIALIALVLLNIFLTSGLSIVPTIPSDCSNTSIKNAWDNIFQIDSSNINISTSTNNATVCNAFYAYKTNGNQAYVLVGKNFNNEVKILGFYANATSAMISSLNISSINYTDDKVSTFLSGINTSRIYSRTLNLSNASSEFNSVFKASPVFQQTGDIFVAGENDTTLSGELKTDSYTIFANYTSEWFLFSQTAGGCVENWVCSNWTSCTNSTQNRTCNEANNCNSTNNTRLVTQSCNITLCTPSWICGAWSACSSGSQTRTCTDSHLCGLTINNTKLDLQACNSTCTPSWSCEDWPSQCQETGQKERNCTDLNNCVPGKTEAQLCTYHKPAGFTILIVIIVLIILIIAGFVAYSWLKKPSSSVQNIVVSENKPKAL